MQTEHHHKHESLSGKNVYWIELNVDSQLFWQISSLCPVQTFALPVKKVSHWLIPGVCLILCFVHFHKWNTAMTMSVISNIQYISVLYNFSFSEVVPCIISKYLHQNKRSCTKEELLKQLKKKKGYMDVTWWEKQCELEAKNSRFSSP